MFDKTKIDNGNREIAKMLGWFEVEGQKQTWFVNDGNGQYVVYQQYKDQYKELPFHKDWNWLQEAKEKLVLLTGKKIADVARVHMEKLGYEVNVATLTTTGWEWVSYESSGNETPVEMMFIVVSELAEKFNKEPK